MNTNGNGNGTLLPDDLTRFAALGISAELLARAGVERVSDEEARSRYGITGYGDRGGIVFPRFNPTTGQRVGARLRRDHPELENGQPKNKYISAFGDRQHLFFPPGAGALLDDASVPVVLLEAEKSALALIAWAERTGRKILPLALGGCWGWRGRIGKSDGPHGERVDETGPLPDLLRVAGKGRRIIVLLDANVRSNFKVQAAQRALVAQVIQLGAIPLIADLPTIEGVNGPDDYIGVAGDEAMAKVLDGARAVTETGLPACPEVEASLLAGVIAHPGSYPEIARIVDADAFFVEPHRRIWRCMGRMADNLEPIDKVTLTHQLAQCRELEVVGGAEFIASLAAEAPQEASLSRYAGILKEKADVRRLIIVAQRAIARAKDGDTPAPICADLLESILDLQAGNALARAVSPAEFMPEVIRELEREAKSPDGLIGFPTGVKELDQVLAGVRRGELIVIGARPGAGKTALACQIVAENAKAGNRVGVFSLEMSRWDLGRRFLAGVTEVGASNIRKPMHIRREDWANLAAGAAEIADWPVFFDDSGSIRLPELLARARVLITRHKVQLVVVDYLTLVQADGKELRERVGKVADGLRILAKTERVAVILLSQLRKLSSVDAEPTMLDLKDSGDIEAHAHVALLLHTPTDKNGAPTRKDTIIIGKNRNGARGPVPVTFNPKTLRFDERKADAES